MIDKLNLTKLFFSITSIFLILSFGFITYKNQKITLKEKYSEREKLIKKTFVNNPEYIICKYNKKILTLNKEWKMKKIPLKDLIGQQTLLNIEKYKLIGTETNIFFNENKIIPIYNCSIIN